MLQDISCEGSSGSQDVAEAGKRAGVAEGWLWVLPPISGDVYFSSVHVTCAAVLFPACCPSWRAWKPPPVSLCYTKEIK